MSTYSSAYPKEIYNFLGEFHSKKARNYDFYVVNEVDTLELFLDEYGEIYIQSVDGYFEMKVDKDLSFSNYIGECDDVGCAGLADVYGEIKIKRVNGKIKAQIFINMSIFRDTSEDIDCDEINCDELDFSDFYQEWEEKFVYEFTGSIQSSTPEFIVTSKDKGFNKIINSCEKVLDGKAYKLCPKLGTFKFTKSVDQEKIKNALNFLDTRKAKLFSREKMVEFLESKINVLLEEMRLFNSSELTNKEMQSMYITYKSIIKRSKLIPAQKIYIDISKDWNTKSQKISVVFFNTKNKVFNHLSFFTN